MLQGIDNPVFKYIINTGGLLFLKKPPVKEHAMSLPVFCATCHDIIDTEEPSLARTGIRTRETACPGKGNHVREEDAGKECFGLLKKVRVSLVGGRRSFYNYEYIGPKNKALLLLALFHAWTMNIRVFIGGKIVEVNAKEGLHGEGFALFQDLGQKVT